MLDMMSVARREGSLVYVSFSSTHSLSLTSFPDWIRHIEERIGVLLIRLDFN